MPLASVVALPPVTEPPPVATEKSTATPETGFPCASVTSTEGAVPTFVFTVALWLSPPWTASEPAVPARPVAWNTTSLSPVAEAVSAFAPAVVPSFQLPTAAMPLALVVALVPVAEPAPDVTAKVTATPATGLPKVSLATTDGALETLVSTVALWLSPPFTASEVAAPAVPVAWKVIVERPVEAAVSVLAPAVWPSFQLPTVATPPAFVVALVPAAEPPAEPTAKVTPTPATGLPYWSVTETDGAVETSVFAVADWLSPPEIAIAYAPSAVPVAWNVTLPTLELAVSVFEPAVVPSVHEPTAARPPALVVGVRPVAEPPPAPTA